MKLKLTVQNPPDEIVQLMHGRAEDGHPVDASALLWRLHERLDVALTGVIPHLLASFEECGFSADWTDIADLEVRWQVGNRFLAASYSRPARYLARRSADGSAELVA